MKNEYIEKIYAGWLAKIIGIRLGAPIEGWTYDKIQRVYGELRRYPLDYRDFAADDDSNGPVFFLRALEDSGQGKDLSAQAVGETLLNYAPYEHGFFWWGGYGISTEHTAYLNLRNGIPAPQSGSVELNGATVAEQIGGQIFIDTWGLVCPGNPDLAARLAEKAASVTHGGNGIYGGIFIAAAIALAFEEKSIEAIISKGLAYLPADCEYRRVAEAVRDFHKKHPDNWRDCYRYIFENFGYDKYPGNCHIIPNSAVMILSLLYGKGDFSETLHICNMCGWDTDCNVGNVATIMGVLVGLEGIDHDTWRLPINDFYICSSVMGSMNILDIPGSALYMAKQAWDLAGEAYPPEWKEILSQANLRDSCHFEFPGSTHAIRVRSSSGGRTFVSELRNSTEEARSGKASLRVHARPVMAGERVYVYKKTYYTSQDFHDSRYDPSFSPILYPGQTIGGSVFIPPDGQPCHGFMYARDASTGNIIEGEKVHLEKGIWYDLCCTIPFIEGGLIDEAGWAFETELGWSGDLACLVDQLVFSGEPQYSMSFSPSSLDVWSGRKKEIMQCTRLKGLFYIEGEEAHLSSADFAEVYTGHHDWTDYTAEFCLRPLFGEEHSVNVRVQGAIRSYALGFDEGGKFCLYKNEDGYRLLEEKPFAWELGKTYTIKVECQGKVIKAWVDGKECINYTDQDKPYLRGALGFSNRNGSRTAFTKLSLRGLP
ncbi:MAG: ADP-ribosylglycohydrolase family protein [Treponema sp.]|nr:ADP-ribosylglycohydrolase family protein [Treponema sp.]